MNGQAVHKRRLQRAAVWAALLAAVALIGGCENVYRVNHMHSDANQKAAEQSLEAFENFTSQTAGLEPTLLKNLDARRQLEDAVGASRSRVRDTDASGLTTDATWERLRLETYVKLGLLQRDKDEDGNELKPPRPLILDDLSDLEYAQKKVAAEDYNKRLSRRIATREMKVTAIAKVLKLIGDANKVIAEETDKKYQATQDELEKYRKKLSPITNPTTTPATQPSDSTGNARIQWVRQLFQTIVDSRKTYLDNPVLLKAANEVQRRLLADIESSRDPVEAAALVAVVGTGLSDFDFVILDAYVLELDDRLAELDQRIEHIADEPDPLGGGRPSKDAPKTSAQIAWEGLRQSLCEARVWVKVAVWLTIAQKDPDRQFVSAGVRTRWTDPVEAENHKQAFLRANLQTLSSREPKLTDERGGDPVARARDALAVLLAECQGNVHDHSGPARIGVVTPTVTKAAVASVKSFSTPRRARISRYATALDLNPAEQDLLLRAEVIGQGRDGSALLDTVDAIRRSRQLVKDSASKVHISAKAVTLAAAANAPARELTKDAPTSAKARSMVGLASLAAQRAATAIDRRKPALVAGRSDLGSVLGDSGLTDLDAEKGFQLLNNFLGLDAQIAGYIDQAVKNKTISEDELKFLGGIVTDFNAEQSARHERILIFLNDLYGAAVDLGQENSRHAQGMLTVANIEFRRWVLLGLLNDNYQEVYGGQTTPATSRLFQTQQEVDKLIADHAPGGTAAQPDLRKHPAVAKTGDRIWTSIRKLTETVAAFHRSAQVNDPDGFNLTTANDRLFKAVRTVDGHLLMISLNQHISEENVARLHAELASHDIRLDTLKTRVEEAGYRLTLGDLKAFHTSGVTDQDIQTIADVFANGFLAWIGSGTNNGGK